MKRFLKLIVVFACVLTTMGIMPAKASENIYGIEIDVTNNQKEAQDMLALINAERAKAGVAPLKWSNSIENSANLRAAELTVYYSHTRPNDTKAFTAITVNSLTMGENIALGQRSKEEVMTAWMNSEGHRQNILNPNFKNIGVGSVKIGNRNYWVQMFAGSNIDDVKQTPKTNVQRRTISVHEKYLQNIKLFFDKTSYTKGESGKATLEIINQGSTSSDVRVPIASDTINWTSSNTGLFTIGTTGNLKALSGGTATITAKLKKYPSLTASGKINCSIPYESISMSASSLKLEKGQTKKLSVSFQPSDANNKPTLKWSSSNTAVAKVDQNGTVTALKNGTVTIYADTPELIDFAEKLVEWNDGLSYEGALQYARQAKRNETASCEIQVVQEINWTSLEAPKNVKASANTYNSLKISWDLTDGGTYYQVYRSTSRNGKYSLLGVYDSQTTSSFSRSLATGTTYYYKVRAYRWKNGERLFSPFSAITTGTPKLSAPKNVSTGANTSTSLKINWDKVYGGTYYQVYRSTSKDGKYALLGVYDNDTSSSVSRSLATGQTYYYKVRTYRWVNGERVFSPFSSPVSGKPVLQKSSKVTATPNSATTAKITWNKIEGATYYQVYRGTSMNGTYALLGVYDSKTFSSTSRSLKRGQTYYYKVRGYKWVNGVRVFSPFSTPIYMFMM